MASKVHVNGPLIEHMRLYKAFLNRKEAAKKLKMTDTALYYIERGRNGEFKTSPGTLRKIAKLLKVEPEELTAAVNGGLKQN